MSVILWGKMPSKKHFYHFFQYYPLVRRDIYLENGHGGIRHLHTNVSKQSADIWSRMKAVIDRNSPLKWYFWQF